MRAWGGCGGARSAVRALRAWLDGTRRMRAKTLLRVVCGSGAGVAAVCGALCVLPLVAGPAAAASAGRGADATRENCGAFVRVCVSDADVARASASMPLMYSCLELPLRVGGLRRADMLPSAAFSDSANMIL